MSCFAVLGSGYLYYVLNMLFIFLLDAEKSHTSKSYENPIFDLPLIHFAASLVVSFVSLLMLIRTALLCIDSVVLMALVELVWVLPVF